MCLSGAALKCFVPEVHTGVGQGSAWRRQHCSSSSEPVDTGLCSIKRAGFSVSVVWMCLYFQQTNWLLSSHWMLYPICRSGLEHSLGRVEWVSAAPLRLQKRELLLGSLGLVLRCQLKSCQWGWRNSERMGPTLSSPAFQWWLVLLSEP